LVNTLVTFSYQVLVVMNRDALNNPSKCYIFIIIIGMKQH